MNRLLSLLLLLPLLVLTQTAFGAEKPYEIIEDLVYSNPNGLPLLLDLYLPDVPPGEQLPVVVWVHGGGWTNRSREQNSWPSMAMRLPVLITD